MKPKEPKKPIEFSPVPVEAQPPAFTKLESEIIGQLAIGKTVEQIHKDNHIATKMIQETIKKTPVQEYLQKILDKAGATDEVVARVIAEGLSATNQREFLAKNGDDSKIITGKEKPDFAQRHTTAMDVMRLKGNLQSAQEVEAGGNTFNLFQTIINARKERGLDGGEPVIDVKVVEEKKP